MLSRILFKLFLVIHYSKNKVNIVIDDAMFRYSEEIHFVELDEEVVFLWHFIFVCIVSTNCIEENSI